METITYPCPYLCFNAGLASPIMKNRSYNVYEEICEHNPMSILT